MYQEYAGQTSWRSGAFLADVGPRKAPHFSDASLSYDLAAFLLRPCEEYLCYGKLATTSLYAPAGRWAHRLGPARLLQGALGLRLLAFGGLLALGWFPMGGHSRLALVGCTVVVLCWAGLGVSSTTLTAHFAPNHEGAGMGLLNATSALAGVCGAALGGWLAARWGYQVALGLAVAGLTLGLCLSLTLRPKP